MNTIMLNALKYVFTNDRRDNINERNRDIVIRLKFIGTFQPGEKVDIKNLKIESNSILTPIKRFMQGESREHTYSFLNSTIDRSFEIVNAYSKSEKMSERLLCKNILEDMIKAIRGLQNIQKTYKDDKLFYCNIETIIETIHSKLSETKEKFPDIFTLKGIFSENKLDTIFEDPIEVFEEPIETKEPKKKDEPIKKK
jgi:hypothetical protein